VELLGTMGDDVVEVDGDDDDSRSVTAEKRGAEGEGDRGEAK
jgi:hypothetical protein